MASPGERGTGAGDSEPTKLCCRRKRARRDGVEGRGTVTTEEESTLGLPGPAEGKNIRGINDRCSRKRNKTPKETEKAMRQQKHGTNSDS